MSEAGNSPGSEGGTPSSAPGSAPPAEAASARVIYGPYTKGSGATSPAAQPPVRHPPADPSPQRTEWTYATAAGQSYGTLGGRPVPAEATVRMDYARWSQRAVALLVDDIPALIALGVFFTGYGLFLAAVLRSTSPGLPSEGRLLMLLGGGLYLVAIGWTVYNRWIRAGRTGQSVGKQMARIALVSDLTHQPIGAFNAFVRDLVHILDGLAYVGFLWPLWDEKRQTFADKLVRTIVVAAP
jgi:uncharacterized RDD family membrane protein YckC